MTSSLPKTDFATPARSLVLWERALLALAIFGKCFALWRRQGAYIGFDLGDHLPRLQEFYWWSPEPALRAMYYAYHPPVGFFLPNLIFPWIEDAVLRVQCFNTACSLLCLLLLRATLRHLRLLDSWPGILFLYLWAGIPLLINAGFSLNLDLPLFVTSLACLFFSVKLLTDHRPGLSLSRIIFATAITLSIAAGFMIKFSGLLACSIPVFVAFFFSQVRFPFQTMLKAAIPVFLGMALVLPYYWQRYYVPERTIFPRNNAMFYQDDILRSQILRDQDRIGFITRFFTPALLQPAREVDVRDREIIRLSDAWRDFFIADRALYFPAPDPSSVRGRRLLGQLYQLFFFLSLPAGLALWLRGRGKWLPTPFAKVVLAQGVVFLLSLSLYCYIESTPVWNPAKALYILPCTLAIALFASETLAFLLRKPAGIRILPWLLAGWLLTNHLWPVY